MSGAAGSLDSADGAEPARWAGCMALVLALHAAAALVLIERAPEIGAALDREFAGDRDGRVFLRADTSVPYGELMETMNALRAAGYLKVALVGLDAGRGAP